MSPQNESILRSILRFTVGHVKWTDQLPLSLPTKVKLSLTLSLQLVSNRVNHTVAKTANFFFFAASYAHSMETSHAQTEPSCMVQPHFRFYGHTGVSCMAEPQPMIRNKALPIYEYSHIAPLLNKLLYMLSAYMITGSSWTTTPTHGEIAIVIWRYEITQAYRNKENISVWHTWSGSLDQGHPMAINQLPT